MFHGFPLATRGLRIGLLGGSFDPPHNGHVLITRRAIKRFDLDFVWWLVTPGNPLKEEGPALLERRLGACHKLVEHPRIVVTGIEARLGTRYTYHTLNRLMEIYSSVNFMWLMGADNMAGLHHWDNWRGIMEMLPVGVLSRPGEQLAAGFSPAAKIYSSARRSSRAARSLVIQKAPAWSLLNGPMLEISSTKLRNSGQWVR